MADKIAFTEEYEAKALSLMLHDPSFSAAVRDTIVPENFSNRALQWFYDRLSNPDKSHTPITLKEEMIGAAKDKTIREDELDRYIATYKLVVAPPLPAEVTHVRETVSAFVRTQNVKNTILQSFDLMEQGEWDQITDKVAAACRSGVDLEDHGQFFFREFADRLERRDNREQYSRFSTGIPDLDDVMNGGIKSKQLGLIIGGTGRGKSVFLSWLARVAVLHGKKVAYLTLEMPEDDIASRFDSMFGKVRFSDLRENKEILREQLAPYQQRYADSLVIKEWPAMQASVWTIKSYLMRLSAMGTHFDMVIVDYLDLIKPHTNYNSATEDADAIAKALHGLAKELNIAIWTAGQLNRGGLAMETPDETAVAGNVSRLFTVDVSLFMAQTSEEREDEYMRLIVQKNRNGLTGRTIKLSTNYSYMTFYRGNVRADEAET